MVIDKDLIDSTKKNFQAAFTAKASGCENVLGQPMHLYVKQAQAGLYKCSRCGSYKQVDR